MSTILDQISSGIGGLVGSPAQGTKTSTTKTALMSILLEMLEDGKLGLSALVNKFHNNGMSNQVDSWVRSGTNEVISAAQVEQALGKEQIEQIATHAGLPVAEASHQLATVIPTMIDKFTPDGSIPEPGLVQQAASLLRTRLGM